MDERCRIAIIRNPSKPAAEATLATLVAGLDTRARVVATATIDETAEVVWQEPHRIIVLGGDGSILAVARALRERQVPIIGVNFGKLGFLAEFRVEDVLNHLDAILNDRSIISNRLMLQAAVHHGEDVCEVLAINDCVVHSGPPYRMIELALSVDGQLLTTMSGDGLVLATPCGSTAHNMSVGGPILQSVIPAIVLTPIAPHSLTHRPLVVAGNSTIEVLARQVNVGTTVVADGQVSLCLAEGDRLTVCRYPHNFQLVHNPAQPRWYMLTKKLRWGQ